MSGQTLAYEHLGGDRHRHGNGLSHSHHHDGPHIHERESHSHGHDHHGHGGHGHSHGLVDESIKRSREGLKAVGLSLVVLGFAALAQLAIFIASGSIALFADLIHNFGDAATALPLALAGAGVIGFTGNWIAAVIRTRAGHRLDSPALTADGNHARADSYVSLAVVATAVVVALGLPIADR